MSRDLRKMALHGEKLPWQENSCITRWLAVSIIGGARRIINRRNYSSNFLPKMNNTDEDSYYSWS
jgi:hypothetical protein